MGSKMIPAVALRDGYLAYREEIDEAIRRVLNSGFYILGPEVTDFESAFAAWCRVDHCIGVGNGTDAITLALRSLAIGSGDAVLTVSHTAVATVAAIELAGATPILVDINAGSYTIDPEKLEATIRSFSLSGTAGRLKAVIAVHLYGLPCDMGSIREICHRYGLYLIEDCAQAHGAALNGQRVGSLGDAACFSFYPTKNLGAFGDGGAVLTSNPEVAKRCRALREYGWQRRYESDLAGMNSRLDEIHAAMLAVRLKHLDREIEIRRAVARRYNSGLEHLVNTPRCGRHMEHAYHLYVIRTNERDGLNEYLRGRGINSAIHYPFAVHQQPAYLSRLHLGIGGMAVTETVVQEILSLPIHPFMSSSDVDVVISAIADWSAGRGAG